jgi:hypothetical protein
MSDLNIRATGLLNFAEQSLKEGLKDPSTMLECFSDADSALRILAKILLKEDQQRYARLALIDIFRISFVGMAEAYPANLASAFNDPCEKIKFAKTFFSDEWQIMGLYGESDEYDDEVRPVTSPNTPARGWVDV